MAVKIPLPPDSMKTRGEINLDCATFLFILFIGFCLDFSRPGMAMVIRTLYTDAS